ncbi:hypothetical protein JOC94_001628 [Bacillus thermophilus]|uniref:Transposase n=1 Tax=Siminovitchia thermophila TaxID=1245522 RepID=A0ABS2R4T3_9BACI|nr:hypothetical protein [Siminovitchia thermophila]MBM7714656.1 hypothetical protein [Siminovitchia thermophila]ONK22697.1 hypothetical protein BLX87_15115 [Bacillus sp. VT-16-64]
MHTIVSDTSEKEKNLCKGRIGDGLAKSITKKYFMDKHTLFTSFGKWAEAITLELIDEAASAGKPYPWRTEQFAWNQLYIAMIAYSIRLLLRLETNTTLALYQIFTKFRALLFPTLRAVGNLQPT